MGKLSHGSTINSERVVGFKPFIKEIKKVLFVYH